MNAAQTTTADTDGTPRTILGQINSTRRGLLLLTHISDSLLFLRPDQFNLWSLGCGQWYLTFGSAVPDWKLRKLAETEGIDFDGLIRLRDGLLEVQA